jgi:cellulose synthase/poly-beta-1,6-N-acetylglucosamine synthase-like glycosyltransferase
MTIAKLDQAVPATSAQAAAQAAENRVPTRVTVIIPVFNGGADLDKGLGAIAASTYPVFETILVDDGSTDGMTQPAATRHGAGDSASFARTSQCTQFGSL